MSITKALPQTPAAQLPFSSACPLQRILARELSWPRCHQQGSFQVILERCCYAQLLRHLQGTTGQQGTSKHILALAKGSEGTGWFLGQRVSDGSHPSACGSPIPAPRRTRLHLSFRKPYNHHTHSMGHFPVRFTCLGFWKTPQDPGPQVKQSFSLSIGDTEIPGKPRFFPQ